MRAWPIAAAVLALAGGAKVASLVSECRSAARDNHQLQGQVHTLEARLDDDTARMDAIDHRMAMLGSLTRSAPAPRAETESAALAASEPSPRPATITPAQADATQALGGLVDDGIARGRWTRDDVASLRRLVASAQPEVAQDALGRLAVAINSGQLVLEDPRRGPI